MKRFILFFSLSLATGMAFAQDQKADSARAALVNYKNPIERFTATIKYLENVDTYGSNAIDSALCIDLLQMAQSLKNDSLLATSYN